LRGANVLLSPENVTAKETGDEESQQDSERLVAVLGWNME
jgi:hypothetical protein